MYSSTPIAGKVLSGVAFVSRSFLRCGLIVTAIVWLSLPVDTWAVSPEPDGGYPNGNTAEGLYPLLNLTSGGYNTAIGYEALYNNSSGSENTATGGLALYNNLTGNFNTASGVDALSFNRTGAYNTATGFSALNAANAADNTATGALALQADTTGFYNTATGVSALYSNTTGYYNVATGVSALTYNVVGHDNTAEGFQALLNNKGSSNIGIGSNAGANLSTGSNNIDIGTPGVAGESAKIRIGKQGTQKATFIAGIYNVNEGGTIKPVYINSNGQLGTQPLASSRRFKDEIKPMDQTSEAILGLKPVTFQYKNDSTGTAQFGLIAEEVAKLNPGLVVRDEDGEIYTVRYEAVNAMLLNEFLKEHGQVQELKATAARQQTAIARQQKQIEALTATVQKVTDQLELNKVAPQVVVSNH